MSTLPHAEMDVLNARPRGISPVQYASLATVLAALGLSTIWFPMLSLWTLWTTDALKSIGMVIPIVSLVLILRAWRGLSWAAEGTWWGLVLLLITAAVVREQQQNILIMVVSPHWLTVMPPPSMALLAYGSGVVLLMGGVRLYRAALFPILLLFFANPVPHAFTSMVDLPLQHASAHVARAFAMRLGHTLTPDHLRLMFTPDFGMFIAPGCNGIRGSVTMGFIALIAGYVYKFRWYANALVTMGSVLLAYVFNLARLCLLVLYYAVALHIPWLQNKAENADYVIGAALFLIATLLLFAVIHRLRGTGDSGAVDAAIMHAQDGAQDRPQPIRVAQLAALGTMVVLGCIGLVRARAAITPYGISASGAPADPFPARLGSYSLVRTWNETMATGSIVYAWAQYAPPDGGRSIAIGISPVLGWHDPLVCHFSRGEEPLWHGPLTIATAGSVPVDMNSSFYNDGARQYVEASTLCSGASCGEFATERTHFGFVYTHPEARAMLAGDSRLPIRVLLRVETIDMALPGDAARQGMTQDLRNFLASVNLEDLTRSYGR